MVADDHDRIEGELVANFKQLGLNKYEAQTLISLYRLGSGTAKDIARVNDVPRTRVYDAAESLHELGLVDIQYSTPQKFSIVSRESLIRKLNLDREHTIQSVDDLLSELEPTEPQREEFGVWTVSGRDSVSDRVREFIDEAEDRIVLMTIDELLTDTHIDALREAVEDRDVDVFVAGLSPESEGRIRDEVPSVELFESLWEWSDAPAGRLLVTDEEAALVSALVDGHTAVDEETAIWGRASATASSSSFARSSRGDWNRPRSNPGVRDHSAGRDLSAVESGGVEEPTTRPSNPQYTRRAPTRPGTPRRHRSRE